MLRVGLTGGIGSGKSTVAQLFANRGVPIIDADAISRSLTAPGQPATLDIARRIGPEFVRNGTLDRRQLAERVFHDPATRAQLEDILHPRIREAMNEQVASTRAPYCILAIPLLVESRQRDLVDRVLAIDLDETAQIQRVVTRDRRPEHEVRAILAAQATRADRLAAADDVIENSGSPADLEHSVELLHRRYLAMAAGA